MKDETITPKVDKTKIEPKKAMPEITTKDISDCKKCGGPRRKEDDDILCPHCGNLEKASKD